jgi:hypothetical protein
MYPHERSLVSRLEGKPFALIGVNSDEDRNELKQVLKDEQITWRSFLDGPGGPIARRWRIEGWPSLFVIDAKGVIRNKFVGSPPEEQLNRIVDALMRETVGN